MRLAPLNWIETKGTSRTVPKKIVLGNELDTSWRVASEDEIIAQGYKPELDEAKNVIARYSYAGISEKGPVWTECWLSLKLEYSSGDPAFVKISKKTKNF